MFEICHYIRLETIWALCQMYDGYGISRMDKIIPSSSLTRA